MNEPGATPDGLKLAFTFLLTVRGTPLIYYGDEIALPGWRRPRQSTRLSRAAGPAMPRNAFDAAGRTPAEQARVVARAASAARCAPSRTRPAPGADAAPPRGEQAFVYRRGRSVIALNNDTAAVTVRLPGVSLGDGRAGRLRAAAHGGRRDAS